MWNHSSKVPKTLRQNLKMCTSMLLDMEISKNESNILSFSFNISLKIFIFLVLLEQGFKFSKFWFSKWKKNPLLPHVVHAIFAEGHAIYPNPNFNSFFVFLRRVFFENTKNTQKKLNLFFVVSGNCKNEIVSAFLNENDCILQLFIFTEFWNLLIWLWNL